MNGYPEVLVSSEQIAKDVFDGADSSGLGIDMVRAQLLAARLNAILFPGFADAYLPSGEQVRDVMSHADQILNDHANGVLHDKAEITAVKDLLDAANNSGHEQSLTTCPGGSPPALPPASGTPTPTPSTGPCDAFSGGLSKEYWKTHTGLDSPQQRDRTYKKLPILLGISPDGGAPEANVDSVEAARDLLQNANSSGHGYTMLRAQLLAAKLNALKFPGFDSASLASGEVVGAVMDSGDAILNDAAGGSNHTKAEIIVVADLLDEANNNGLSQALYTCDIQGEPNSSTDYDGDGFSDEAEGLHIGTNAAVACGGDGWPADLVPGGFQPNKVNLEDLASFVAPTKRIASSPGDANFEARWDLVPGSYFGKWINLSDMAALIAGPSAYPPMLNGQKAFGGPACQP